MRLLAVALLSIHFVTGAAIDYSVDQDEGENIKLLANVIAEECGEANTEQAHYICVATFIKRVMNQLQSDANLDIVPFDPPFPGEPPDPFNPPGPGPDYPIKKYATVFPAPPTPFEPVPPREPGPDEMPFDIPSPHGDDDRYP